MLDAGKVHTGSCFTLLELIIILTIVNFARLYFAGNLARYT